MRPRQAPRGGLAAGPRGSGDPAAHQRRVVSPAADPRRGAPVRDHAPPVPAVQDHGGEPSGRRAGAGRSPTQEPAQAVRVSQAAAGCHSEGDRRGARHRHPDRRGDRRGAAGAAAAAARSAHGDRQHSHRWNHLDGARYKQRGVVMTGVMHSVAQEPSRLDHRGEVVVVTGMTGAGRSTAAKELEDLGYYVVDNMPPQLVADVVRLVDESRGPMQPIAVVVDVRSGSFFSGLQEVLARGTTGRRRTLLFLEANDDVLVRRQEAARRPHPLQEGGRLLDGLRRERVALNDLRGDADLIIDTSALNVHQLTDKVADAFGTEETTSLQATIVSFGFKYGIPVDADLVADMRFLPNPHWVPDLRPLSGRDEPVARYVLDRPEARAFLDQYVALLETVSTGYLREGKRFMTVAIGCTGGKHRSVATTEEIASRLAALGLEARPFHRDLGRE